MHLVAIDMTGHDPEVVADRCWQAGATGLWEIDEDTVRAGVAREGLMAFLDALADLDPVDVTETESVELPGSRSSVPVGKHVIELWVPAPVFGDGTHPTTATCLALLSAVVRAGVRVLDVGCGAGAVTVGAAILGGEVTAIDIDTEAVAATRDNAARNGVAVEVSATPLSGLEGCFDVVVANMTVGSLLPLVGDLVARSRPGGTLVVSGMLEHQWPEVRHRCGGTVEQVRVADGWATAVVRIG